MELSGAHVVITGGSRGIGLAIARAMVAQGARLTLVGRDRARLEEACREVSGLAVAADLADEQQLARVLPAAQAAHGPVDVLVNNAGVNVASPLGRCSAQDLRTMMLTNLYAPLELTRSLLGPMLARRRGVIVNISSLAGDWAMRSAVGYGSTKAGLTLATRTLQRELKGTGVVALLVVLGLVDTDMTAGAAESDPFARAGMERFAKQLAPLPPELVARRVVDALAQDRRRDLVLPATAAPLHKLGKINTRVADLLFARLPPSY
jgi:uncharacterized protein